jgi:predicted dehydrogenase
VGFVGTGFIARCHAFALSALPHYYDDAPTIVPAWVTSARPERAQDFARRHGFAAAAAEADFWTDAQLDAVFVLGPNRLHFEHAQRALALPSVRRIYLEKPVCVTRDEALAMAPWTRGPTRIQVGHQLLQMASVRRAWQEREAGLLGTPVHFKLSLLHSGYLDPAYRAARSHRLAPMPEGGVFVDLGSHLLSLAIAFLGPALTVMDAHALSPFPEVDPRSDLHGVAVLRDEASGALGTITASRIAAGHEESLELEFAGTRGALRVSSRAPDAVEICADARRQEWRTVHCGSEYEGSRFPSRAAAAGWLRPLIHAQYVFFKGEDSGPLVPDLAHGLAVQRLLHEIADKLGRS